MTAIEVAKLRLKCPTEHRDSTRFAIEDGLRTSIPDDRRLVLLRKLRLTGNLSSLRPDKRNSAVRDGWLTAISGARHGGDDGAADANCVWFESREEAETSLLSRLLTGRAVDAWYWRLALPNWRGRPLRVWVAEILPEAISRGEDRRVLAITAKLIAAGAIQLLIDVIIAVAPKNELLRGPRFTDELLDSRPSERQRLLELADEAGAELVSSLPSELRQTIATLLRTGEEGRAVVQAIVRAWLLNRSPALAVSPVFLLALIRKVIEAASAPKRQPLHRAQRLRSPPPQQWTRPKSPKVRLVARAAGTTSGEHTTRTATASATATAEDASEIVSGDEPPVLEPGLVPRHRLYSACAGLWLVIPSLVELGFREWLEDRPSMLGENPGSRLLHEISRHHRIHADDPTLAVLGSLADPHERADWARLWRHGLDRWLRRTVGRRLHDLVNRPGEISFGDLKLVVHYPPTHADLALRRRALDRDPGWTDWLGLSIRYNFGGTEDWL